MRDLKNSGFVYFIASDDGKMVKIGVTKNPKSRFSTLQTAAPMKLRQVGLIETDNPYELEKKLHGQYRAHRKQGEWFDIPENMAASIIQSYQRGFHQTGRENILKSIELFKEIAKAMAIAPRHKQDPTEFYSFEDLNIFDESLKNYAYGMTNRDTEIHYLAKMLSLDLFLLLQANAYGNPEVNMQERARDIIGFIKTFSRHLSVYPEYEEMEY